MHEHDRQTKKKSACVNMKVRAFWWKDDLARYRDKPYDIFTVLHHRRAGRMVPTQVSKMTTCPSRPVG